MSGNASSAGSDMPSTSDRTGRAAAAEARIEQAVKRKPSLHRPEVAGMLVLAPARERRRCAIEKTATCYTMTVDNQMLGVAGGTRCRGVGERKHVRGRLRGGLAERIEG
jgi:hypothetical protein